MSTKSSTNKNKNVKVTCKFLTDLADKIYDTKSRRFLRLCNGTLQNGPDPTNQKRPMHCGLGELHFAMTGRQPEQDDVSESDVVDLAVKLSPLSGLREQKRDTSIKTIEALGLDADLTDNLVSQIEEAFEYTNDEDIDDAESNFRQALNNIPDVNDNDDDCKDGTCTYDMFRSRSSRVATQLRRAAKHLPA